MKKALFIICAIAMGQSFCAEKITKKTPPNSNWTVEYTVHKKNGSSETHTYCDPFWQSLKIDPPKMVKGRLEPGQVWCMIGDPEKRFRDVANLYNLQHQPQEYELCKRLKKQQELEYLKYLLSSLISVVEEME